MFEIAYGFQLARRALLLAGIFVASCCAVWAQSDQPPSSPSDAPPGEHWRGHSVDRELKKLTEVLSLTADQQTQVKTILAAQQQQMEQLRTQAAANGSTGEAAQSAHDQFKAIHQDTDAKINALLNDGQKTKFAEWQQQRQQMMQRRHGSGGRQAPPPESDNEGT